MWIGYKEKASSGTSAFKVSGYYHTDWMTADKLSLTLEGLTMDAVYESLVCQIAGDNKVQLINTPRDYYVELPISNGMRDKLTHTGIYGVDVSMGALEMLYGIEIPDSRAYVMIPNEEEIAAAKQMIQGLLARE